MSFDNDNHSTAWCDLFNLAAGSSFQGFVNCKDQLEQLKWSFEVETKACFVAVKTSTNFGNTDINSKQYKIQWIDKNFPDHPYIIVSTERYECHHGPDRNRSKKEKAKTAQDGVPEEAGVTRECISVYRMMFPRRQEGDHDTYQKRRYHIQLTKKMNCPAAIIAKEIVFFTEHKGSVSKYRREQVAKDIKKRLADKDPTLQIQRMIFVTLPTSHENHLTGEVSEISLPVDKRVIAKVEEYVAEGFMSSSCIRTLIEQFVRRDIFSGQRCPSWTNRRFFPSQKDISNIIYAAKMKAMRSKFDQENLQANIDDWKRERPEDKFEFCASTVNANEEESESSSEFFFLYQSSWQMRLLNLYGNELCLLDATYRTTKYSIPLFFLCVKTNVDYSVVAVFACQSENSHTITKALNLIKQWNPDWNPKYFMVDHCEAELNAISTSFPDCQSLICDFHREQAWSRWLKATKHGLNNSVDDVLPLLRRVARASTQNDLDSALANLRNSHFWNQHKEFRDWFTNTWLKNIQKWAWLYRKDRLLVNINTNNGVERQNRTLKYDFLTKYIDRTLTGMLTTVIKRYLPDQYIRYLNFNIKASSYYKMYNESLPPFLHNRPKEFVDHCRKRLVTADEVQDKIVAGEGLFTVQSFTDPYTTYAVTLGTDTEVPSCQCHEWLHSHWPCKHMLAIVMHLPGYSWNDLADHYRNNAMFILDQLCLNDIGFKVPADSHDSFESLEEEETVNSAVDTDLPVKTEDDFRKSIREELEMIKAFTYLEIPSNIEGKVLDDLIKVKNILSKAVPSENKLPLLETKPTVKSTFQSPFNIIKRKPKRGKAISIRRKYKELPSRRKRKATKKVMLQKQFQNREQLNFADDVIENLISGTTCLEETPVLPATCKKRGPETMKDDCKDVNPSKRMKVSSSVKKLSENHIDQDQNGKRLKLNFKGQPPCIKKINRVPATCKKRGPETMKDDCKDVNPSKRMKVSSSVKKLSENHIDQAKTESTSIQSKQQKMPVLPKLKEYIKPFSKQHWEKMILKSKNILGVCGRRAGAVLEMASEEPEDLITAIISNSPYKLNEDRIVSVLCQILGEMVDEKIFLLDIDPKKTEQDGETAMKDLMDCLKESSQTSLKSQMGQPEPMQTKRQETTELKKKVKWADHYQESHGAEMEIDKQKAINKIQKIWQGIQSHYFLSTVYGTDVTYEDINSLKTNEWLTDKVMDAYLEYLAQCEMDKGEVKVLRLLVTTTNNIINGRYVLSKNDKNKLKYDVLIGAYHQRGGHWDLLIVKPSLGEIIFLNPMGETPYQKRTVLLNWKKFMGQLLIQNPESVELCTKNWKLVELDHSKQQDGSSCGVYCLMFAEKYLNGQPLGFSQEQANIKRQHIAEVLMMFEGQLDGCCPCCGFKVKLTDPQISCRICNKIFHRKSHCVGENIASNKRIKDFECQIDSQLRILNS